MDTIDEDDLFYADHVRETRTVTRTWGFLGIISWVTGSRTLHSYKIIKEEN